jgi:hypothetical protein
MFFRNATVLFAVSIVWSRARSLLAQTFAETVPRRLTGVGIKRRSTPLLSYQELTIR